ncbi:MAG TPA: alkaline phosphatase family protein, partial [Anaerolineae bacterium]|nr:alkaline phosphatase family protein [Anaerolineae bacterium]
LVTGAWPELNGSSLLNAPDDAIPPILADTIFAVARRAGLTTALAGAPWWQKMIPEEVLDSRFYANGFTADDDRLSAEAGLRFLNNFAPNLTFIYFGSLDEAGHEAGATSAAYREVAAQIDDHLRDIVAALDLRHTVLIVTSDHGQVDQGGHGGGEREVMYTPLVAAGDLVIPGDYGTINETDIAPTIAAILGAPVPRLSQGVARFEMLRTDLATRTQVELETALQRRELANLYLPSIGHGALSETAEGDVEVALSSMEVQNVESAYSLARIAVERIDREMAQVRQQRILRERGLRLPLALLVVAVPLVLLILRGGRRGLWLFVAAAVTQLAYHGLYLHRVGLYSFSSIAEIDTTVMMTAENVALASLAGAAIVLWCLIREHEDSVLSIIQTSLGYSLLVVYLLACQAAAVYWLNGFRITWYVPDLTATFWQLSAIVQALVVAGLGLVLPIVLLLAGLVYQGGRALRRRLRPATRS